jgi:hypothetical protein
MSVDDKQNVTLTAYIRRSTPALPESMRMFITEELRQIEASMRSLIDASPQVLNSAPDALRKGMVRYAVAPWNPLNNGYTGLVVYNGSSWVQV